MSDRITLTGVRAFGYHGVLPEERRDGQTFVADVVVEADLSRAGDSDDLADTIDYAAVAQAVVEVIEGEPCRLIETVADRIARAVLASPLVEQVTVTLHKPQAPIPVPFDDVTVTLTRSSGAR
jgi:dihydroneopterin aldolase